MVRDHRETTWCAINPANPGERLLPEVSEARGALAKRELERGDAGERGAELENFDALAARGISEQRALAEAVDKLRRVQRTGLGLCGIHVGAPVRAVGVQRTHQQNRNQLR